MNDNSELLLEVSEYRGWGREIIDRLAAAITEQAAVIEAVREWYRSSPPMEYAELGIILASTEDTTS